MVHDQVVAGENNPQIWRVAVNILNKQSQTDKKGSPPTWGLGGGLTTPHCRKLASYKMLFGSLNLDFLNDLGNRKWT
jgi:hypothetical protein